MARSDSFFIRATVETDGTTFAQASIDLGSFVDALGKTVLRIHNISNRSVIASGQLTIGFGASSNLGTLSEKQNAAPQFWTNGYLIAVESIFLGVDQGIDALSQVSVVLECTVETMTAAASMALALSQQ